MDKKLTGIIKPCNIEELAKRLCDKLLMEHHGLEKAVKVKPLAAHFGISYRRMQSVISYAVVKEKKPIGTSTTAPHFGVFWISTEAEREMVIANLDARGIKIFIRKHALTNMPLDQMAEQMVIKVKEAL